MFFFFAKYNINSYACHRCHRVCAYNIFAPQMLVVFIFPSLSAFERKNTQYINCSVLSTFYFSCTFRRNEIMKKNNITKQSTCGCMNKCILLCVCVYYSTRQCSLAAKHQPTAHIAYISAMPWFCLV